MQRTSRQLVRYLVEIHCENREKNDAVMPALKKISMCMYHCNNNRKHNYLVYRLVIEFLQININL